MPKVDIKIGTLDRIWAYFLYNLSLAERTKLSKTINATPVINAGCIPMRMEFR
jgi:hypothetical protein